MEQGLIKNHRLRSYIYMAIYEFFGCVLFIVGINCSQNDATVASLGLFIAATLTGRLSGGHFNMAVTLAVYVVEGKWRKNIGIALSIAIIDIVGAFVGMFVSIGMLGTANTFKLVPPQDFNNHSFNFIIYLLFVEFFFTMILVTTVLFVKYRGVSATTDGMLSNLTVAIAVFVCVRMGGPLSGAGMNPSIAIAIITSDSVRLSSNINYHDDGHLIFLVPYIIGPLLGGLAASGILLLSQKITLEGERFSLKQEDESGVLTSVAALERRRATDPRNLTIKLDSGNSPLEGGKVNSVQQRPKSGLDVTTARD